MAIHTPDGTLHSQAQRPEELDPHPAHAHHHVRQLHLVLTDSGEINLQPMVVKAFWPYTSAGQTSCASLGAVLAAAV